MLKAFTLRNYKNFKDEITIDFENIRDYLFQKDCISDGIITKMLICGRNATGKTNLGKALLDVKDVLYGTFECPYDPFLLNADSDEKTAFFEYRFQFGDTELCYEYLKEYRGLAYEKLEINGISIFECDFEKGKYNFDHLNYVNAETINTEYYLENVKSCTDIPGSRFAFLKWTLDHMALDENSVLLKLTDYVNGMSRITADYREFSLLSNTVEEQNFYQLLEKNHNLQHFEDITSLKGLSNVDVENYISYLHTTISKKTGKPMGYPSQRIYLDCFKSVICWCQLHRPDDVPVTEIFTGNEYTGVNRKLKIDFIPDDVVAQINEALKTEENPYLKYGIIILQSTGMRIGDLLKLRIDCIKPHPISGYTIEWVQHKGRKNKAPMPVRSECVAAIEKLIEITKELRDEADEKDKDTLMIWRVPKGKEAGKVMNLNSIRFNKWFKKFIKDNDIKDVNGDYHNLTSHQFRRTLGTDMLSKGTNINVIRQVLGHSDVFATKRFYADVKDKERAEVFKSVGVIGNINQIQSSAFDNVSEFEWFKANKDKGACMCDGYCTKPVVDGKVCDRLLKRQKCYTCSRYITTPEYLGAHKQHLKNLEKQLEEGVIYGEHYAEHFIPTIEVLKVIIERLEGLQNGN